MTPLRGPILALHRERHEDRWEVRLPACWEQAERVSRRSPQVGPLSALEDALKGELRALLDGDGPVVVGTSSASCRRLFEAVLGARCPTTYFLAGPDFEDDEDTRRRVDQHRARILVRRTSHGLPLGLVVSGRGLSGFAILPDTGLSGQPWVLALTPAQADAAFRLLLHLFWSEASDEATPGLGGRFHEVAEAPFDTREPGRSEDLARLPLSRVREDATAMVAASGDAWTVVDPQNVGDAASWVPAAQIARLWRPPRAAEVERLTTWVTAGAKVLWGDLGLPSCFVSVSRGGLLWCGTDGVGAVRLRLDPRQAGALRQALHGAESNAPWVLRRDIALREITGRVLLPESSQAELPIPSRDVELPEIRAKVLATLADEEPKEWPPPPPLALAVTYRWSVLPPVAPAKAQPAGLVRAWESYRRRTQTRVDECRGALDRLEQEDGTIRRRFAGLIGALLGFDRERRRIVAELDALSAAIPTLRSPVQARQLEERLHGAEKATQEQRTDLEHEISREEERLERASQAEDFDAYRERLRKELESTRADHVRAEASRDGANAELLRLRELPKSKDRTAGLRKSEDEAKRSARLALQLAKRLEKLQADLEVPFEFRPKARGPESLKGQHGTTPPGHRFVPPRSEESTVGIPDEALPSVGVLLEAGERRYLAISLWEDLAAGTAEAERLNAELVAATVKKSGGSR